MQPQRRERLWKRIGRTKADCPLVVPRYRDNLANRRETTRDANEGNEDLALAFGNSRRRGSGRPGLGVRGLEASGAALCSAENECARRGTVRTPARPNRNGSRQARGRRRVARWRVVVGRSPLVVETRALVGAAQRRLVCPVDDGARPRRRPLFRPRRVAKCPAAGDRGTQGACRCAGGEQSAPRARGRAVSDGAHHPGRRRCGAPLKDTLVFSAAVVFFAVLVTTHVAVAFGLARRPPRWRALVALIVFPFAPYFALQERMRRRAFLWLVALVGYAVAVFLSFT